MLQKVPFFLKNGYFYMISTPHFKKMGQKRNLFLLRKGTKAGILTNAMKHCLVHT